MQTVTMQLHLSAARGVSSCPSPLLRLRQFWLPLPLRLLLAYPSPWRPLLWCLPSRKSILQTPVIKDISPHGVFEARHFSILQVWPRSTSTSMHDTS